jgi:NAD(P)-dependent dehydrogenase (short-subunit alcohol dehydrogenase family)
MPALDRKSPILITGCSSGLGRATAMMLRESGYLTVATARDPSTLEPLAAIGCEILQLDVADEASRQAAIADIERRHGAVAVLINNAAFGQYGPLEEVTQDDLRRSFETNVFGLLRMSQLVMPGMRNAGRGRIINISSVAGRITTQGGGVYHMTKYAVEAIADAMRAEVKPFGVDVVSVLPGPFASPYRDKIMTNIPDTGEDSPYHIYKRNFSAYMMHFLDPKTFGTMPLEKVARAVFKAATVARPANPLPRRILGEFRSGGPLSCGRSDGRLVDVARNSA